ncbi:DUF2269 family protein [Saccharothrix coeruleofusca]|uniref:DUF2269 family protein n=1 Tax=Saccharothrix coeruleofusca TaxID=33919 RepID=UPI00166FE22B|nr:DUF2269 family protein [Saccharothrix coeruleofusca]
MKLTPGVRKSVLLLHVVSSVGWLGVTVGNLVLAIAALATDAPGDQHAAYRVMALLGDAVVLPAALAALVSGLLLSVGTQWGLVRYRWVLAKLLLTSVAVVATLFSLRPTLHTARDAVVATGDGVLADVGDTGVSVVAACSVSLAFYVANTALSVFKPWGRTRWA